MEPKGSDLFLYNTIKINTTNGSGTGFFFSFIDDRKRECPILITNKHVINNNENEKVKLKLHVTDDDFKEWSNLTFNLEARWYFHPTQDLCFTYVHPIETLVEKNFGKKVFYFPISEKLIYDNKKLQELYALEEILMTGYPFGLWDEENNFPIFRKGITASHPAYNFNGEENIGLVDIPIFGGNSGSPIYIYNETGYSDKKGNRYLGKRIIFLGVIYQEYSFNIKGEVETIEIPKENITHKVRIDVGRYIKANEILKFREMLPKF